MRTRRSFAAAVLMGAVSLLALGPAIDVGAKGASVSNASSVVRDAVISTLGLDGDVLRTRVSQLVQIDSSDGSEVTLRVPKATDLQSYRNLSGFTNPGGEGEDLVWRSNGDLDALAFARTKKDMPLEVNMSYYLDGKLVSPEDLEGESGEVRIHMELRNVSGDAKTLKYNAVSSPYLTGTVNQYIPMEYIVRIEFPTDQWRNVGGSDVHVQPVGTDMELATASGLLAPPATKDNVAIDFVGHTEKALIPRMQIFSSATASQELLDALQTQFEALKALYGGMGSLGETLTKIYDGTTELVDGVGDMLTGVGVRDEKTGKPVVKLDEDGVPTTLMGAIGLIGDGVSEQILPAIGERDPTTGEGVVVKDEKGHTTTLIGGLQSQKDTYDDDLIPAVKDAIVGIDDFASQVSDGGEQLTDGLDQVRDGLGAILAALQTDDPLNPGFREGLVQVSDGLSALITSLDTTYRAGLTQVKAGIDALITSLDTTFRGGMTQVKNGLSALISQLLTLFRPGLLAVDGGLDAIVPQISGSFRTGLIGLRDGLVGTQGAYGGLDPGLNATLTALISGANSLVTALGTSGDTPTTIIGVLEAVETGTDQLVAGLGDTGGPATTIIGALEAMNAGMAQLLAGLGDNGSPPTTVIGGLEALSAGMTQLLAGLGDNGDPITTVIGALEAMKSGMDQLVAGLGDTGDAPTDATVIGGLQLLQAGSEQLFDGTGQLVDGVLGGLSQIRGGFTNPEFTQEQDALGGKTPKEYFQDCPACFDPTSSVFDPATADPDFQPSLLEVFTLFSEGIRDALPELQSFVNEDPGLVEGLQQIVDGLDEMAKGLQTFDPDDPGLVDGLQLVQGGLQQVSQGLFATNELGVRTTRGQIGDQGDTIGQQQATVKQGSEDAHRTGALGEQAEYVTTTYVFEVPGQSTGTRDNGVRGGLAAFSAAGLLLMWWRPRFGV